MGFLQSVIAEARSTVSESPVSSSPASVAAAGNSMLNASLDGEVDPGADASVSHHPDPSIFTTQVNGPDQVSRLVGRLSDVGFSSAPLEIEDPINPIGNDMQGETVVETVSHESGFRALEGVNINSETSAEPLGTEMMQAEVQPPVAVENSSSPVTVEDSMSDGQGNEPEIDTYSPLTLGEKEIEQTSHEPEVVTGMVDPSAFTSALMTEQNIQSVSDDLDVRPFSTEPVSEDTDGLSVSNELRAHVVEVSNETDQSSHELEEVKGMADPSAFTSVLMTEQSVQPVSEDAAVRPLSNELSERVVKLSSVAADESDAGHVARPERQLQPSAEHDVGVNPEPDAAEKLISRQVERSVREIVIEDRAAREPSISKHQNVAASGHSDDGPSPVTQHIKAVLHQQVVDSFAREKDVAMQSDAVARQPVYQGEGRAYSAAMSAPQPVYKEPEVKISQVDVFIEGPQRPSGPASSSHRPTLSLASRHYLRRI